VHFSIEAFRWRIAVKATLSGVNEILGIGWLPHQPSDAFDDVSTPEFGRVLVLVIPSHITESVYFALHENLITWHACHQLQDTIPVLKFAKCRAAFFSFNTLSLYFFIPFLLIPHWIYLYSSLVANV
jgi:hypothetical protein